MYALHDNVQLVKLGGPTVAGTTVLTYDVTAAPNDNSGTAVAVVANLGTVTGGVTGTCKLQESIDNATWNDIPGCARVFIAGDSDKLVIFDSMKRVQKYVRLVMDRTGANVVVNAVHANFYGIVRVKPVPNTGNIILRRTLV